MLIKISLREDIVIWTDFLLLVVRNFQRIKFQNNQFLIKKKSAQEIMKDFRPLIEILEELKKKAFFSNLSTPDHFYIREYFKKLDSKDFPIVEFKVSLEPSDYNRFEEIKAGNLFSLLFMHGVYVPIDELKDKHHYDHNGIRYSHRNGRQSIVHLTDE